MVKDGHFRENMQLNSEVLNIIMFHSQIYGSIASFPLTPISNFQHNIFIDRAALIANQGDNKYDSLLSSLSVCLSVHLCFSG